MNLLPKTHKEFSRKEYWEAFFKGRGNKTFEWYGEYTNLHQYLHKYIKKQDEILITGCGNSSLGHDLYDAGFCHITNIDISNVVIKQMLEMEKNRPNLRYLQMDALQTEFNDNSYSVVIDKGTLDALMPDNSDQTKITQYFGEIQRLLRFGGRYLCISLLQSHVLNALLTQFSSKVWIFRVLRCFTAEQANNSPIPVFLVITTKFNRLEEPIFELNLNGGEKMQRFSGPDQIQTQINNAQQAAFICAGLKRTSCGGGDDDVTLELYKPDEDTPRFTVHIVDVTSSQKNFQYAAFIVPQGREAEWLFSTACGRRHLAKSTKNNRLAVICLHRDHVYTNMHDIQAELTETVLNLAPSRMGNRQIPFLSIDSDVGQRTVRYRGTSSFSGDYVIEDVQVDMEHLRRLYFSSAQMVIQSEAKLKTVKKSRAVPKQIVDLTHLSCTHHIYMSLGCQWAVNSTNQIAVIGLGGGGLCSFLLRFLATRVHILAIEIDAEMWKIAREWFGLVDSPRLTVQIVDGVDFLKQSAAAHTKFDAVLFDVDSKDQTVGMSCPPADFLTDDSLDNVIELIGTTGLFILNLVLRDRTLRADIMDRLNAKFGTVVSFQLGEDLNEVVMCGQMSLSRDGIEAQVRHAHRDMCKFFTQIHSNRLDTISIEDLIQQLHINNNR